MNTPQIETPQMVDCELRQEQDAARLEMNRRVRGVRYARMRCRRAWSETPCTTREVQFSNLSAILNP